MFDFRKARDSKPQGAVFSDLSYINDLSDENCQEIIGGTTWRIIRDGVTTIGSNDVDDGVTITVNHDTRTITRTRLQREVSLQ